MTQGQGEDKVKLHTMNLVAAGPPLRDIYIFLEICSKYSGVFITLSLSMTAPFPSFLKGKNKKKEDFGPFYGARGTGLGHTDDQWYLSPLHTS